MNDVTEFLQKSKVQHLATVGSDGKPKVRPFQFMLEEQGKLYFCTSNQKEVFTEIQGQPYVELSALGEDFSWMRLRGRVVFTRDSTIKAKVLETSPLVKNIYKTADNPVFEVFFLDKAQATIADFSGKPPKVCKL